MIISLSIILMGFIAMASQIVSMRELLSVFYGNELSIGFILASWLVGGAFGSAVLGRLADRMRFKKAFFSFCYLLLSVALPLIILAIRSLKVMLGVSPGEIMPLSLMLASSLLVLFPICAVLGFMFALACGVYKSELYQGAVRIGKVYVLESIGAIIGGLLASFILIQRLNSFEIMAALSLLSALTGFILFSSSNGLKAKALFVGVALIIFTGVLSIWLFGGWEALQRYSLKREWKGYELLASKNSIYGNIAVTKNGAQVSFFDNGLHLYTIPDEPASEEAVHFALLEHPCPREVLLVGGGVGGLVKEILKHPVERIDYVELDPLIIKLAKDYLPKSYYEPLEDRKVSVSNMDGRLFIKQADTRYDCIIIHIGDPYTAQLNRYYTVEFFEEVKRILKEGGIVSFAVTSSENYINKELRDYLRSIYASLSIVFKEIKIIPGDTAYFLASPQEGLLTYDYAIFAARTEERRLNIKYVREYYLSSRLSAERRAYMEDAVTGKDRVKINRDLKPITYYYGIIFWAARFRDSLFGAILKNITEEKLWKIIFGIYGIIFLFGLTGRRYKRFSPQAALTAVMTTGFSEIAFQIVALLSFQAIYGYVFYKLGLILTSFMIGLAIGGHFIVNIMPKIKKSRRAFIWTQGAIVIYPLILPVFFWWLGGSKSAAVSWLGANIIFAFLPITAGFLGGVQFPLANKICLEDDNRISRVSGLSYGIDLFGSCLGAGLTGAFLIPILGMPKTCLAISGMNFAVLVLLVVSRKAPSVIS